MQEEAVPPVGTMQAWSLTIDRFIDHAARWHGERKVVSRGFDGDITSMSWADIRRKAARLSNALAAHGIVLGDRVGTLAMNSGRHIAAWFGIMGMGAICHTLNPRFSDEQLLYIINHGGDRIILTDRQYWPVLERLLPQCPAVEKVVVLDGDGGDGWDAFLADHDDNVLWGEFDENVAAGLCYTSGTTGDPKGVLYTHRSNSLHTLMIMQPDVYAIGANEVLMPIVPMFHANGWGLIFAAAAVGCKLVLPGARLDGASLHELMEQEGVTVAAAVPTVWLTLLGHLRETRQSLSTLRRISVGGAACSEAIFRGLMDHGIEVRHNWGMTETSPVGTGGVLLPEIQQMSDEEQMRFRLSQGRPIIGTDLRIVDEDGKELPRDGVAIGEFQIRGHSIAGRYYRTDRSALDKDGFFSTGDVGTIDGYGTMRITDRSKDVIKSGGEWISSVDIENMALAHPGVKMAAAIGVSHPKWNERPLLLVERSGEGDVTAEDIRDMLAARLARWAVPDAIEFVDEIPLGATGKIDKKVLRARYAGYYEKTTSS
ncbi:long-chain fatty acid--CoA ligase [Sphingobium subterraneum]|uniref:3-methylmercaptopropionyl-CoA ligase n=1 Tax=Sphingobium subterraneum TaxID=627688 RepID=A0A841IZ68_9SPHN|nr:long-chain fatty acid--CoA ligase [Sphingobium subterraneum]MBB6123704.1 fatty-acyl-CoA synthase [Sphingobium subterraneum]